jgi:hypothetical protein
MELWKEYWKQGKFTNEQKLKIVDEWTKRKNYKFQERLSYAQKSQILNDWAIEFPDMFKDRKSMALHKRIGPLLITISVYVREAWSYKPVCIVNNLSNFDVEGFVTESGFMAFLEYQPWPYSKLEWDYDPPSDIRWYRTPEHFFESYARDKEYRKRMVAANRFHHLGYKLAADKIRQNSWIPIDRDIILDDIIQGVHSYREKTHAMWPEEASIPVYTAAWAGDKAKTEECLEWIIQRKDQFISSKDENWIGTLRTRIAQVDQLRDNVHKALANYKLEKIPYQNIIGAEYQE